MAELWKELNDALAEVDASVAAAEQDDDVDPALAQTRRTIAYHLRTSAKMQSPGARD